jgi:hypothetical protein
MKKVGTVSDIRELTDAEIGAVAGGISGEGIGTALDQTGAVPGHAGFGISTAPGSGSPPPFQGNNPIGFGVLTSPGLL